ncbi:MAG TPA: bifunctional phosphoribosylaminoimidazolecarboxamide formyltransferase/IMP cyclohydrolase, partial [Gammaproteobacteria bacterium]|nr:bifunctional phosphoribosylaminoimidazolecarboxamide formyltransferase/IMP cyclohydrolase [Gammaproteobacteria bacterium]
MDYLIRCGLISVSEKSGIVNFAEALYEKGIKLLSTGGTASLLKQHNIPACPISDYTGFPEIMDGRVKTLHPKIYGGILSRQDQDQAVMREFDIAAIQLVVVNLYPFREATLSPDCDLATAIEHIDIGGVSLLRAAAKNYKQVTVLVDPEDYLPTLKQIEEGTLTEERRFELARKAFTHVAAYDVAIANYFNQESETLFPETLLACYQKKQTLRYGENPHQKAAFYVDSKSLMEESTLTQYQGKELSFNNIVDADTAFSCVRNFSKPACVIVKHANPCGVALADKLIEAYRQAYSSDPISAFGGIIAFNHALDLETANEIIATQFAEVVIAPSIDPRALQSFSQKPNMRILRYDLQQRPPEMEYRSVYNGILIQTGDRALSDEASFCCVTKRQVTAKEHQDLLFAWQVAQFVKSNAIVYAKNEATLAIGAGQPSRIDSVKIACMKAADAGFDTR